MPFLFGKNKVEKKRKIFSIIFAVFIFLITIFICFHVGKATGMTKYARSTGGNWSNDTTWSTTPGGTADTVAPTEFDDVIFDTNSGNVTVDTTTAVAKTLDMATYSSAGTLTITNAMKLSVSGSVTLASGKFTAGGDTAELAMLATGTLITAGNTMGSLTFNGSGQTFTLGDAITTRTNSSVILNYGTLITGSFTHTWGSFNSCYANSRGLDISNSTINLVANSGYWYACNNPFSTFITTNSTLNFTGSNMKFYGNTTSSSSNYNNLNATGSGSFGIDYTRGTFNNFNRTGTATVGDSLVIATAGQNWGLNIANGGTLTLKGGEDNRYRLLVTSGTLGTRRIITLGSGATTDIQRADFRDIGFASPIDLSGITGGAGDALGNNNITFNTPRNMYWKTSTSGTKYYSNYDGANPWYSQTNGGGTNYTDSPLPQDNVFFDASSVSVSTTISLDQPRAGTDINFNGVANSPTITAAQTWTGYGSLTLTSAMTFSATGQWNLEGRGNHTLNFSTQSLYYGAIYAIGSSSSYTAVSNITAKAIWFNYNVSPSVAGTLNMGSYIWNMTSTNSSSPWFIYSGTINSQTSTLQLSGNTSSTTYVIYDTPGNIVYNNINISGTASSSASWQFNNSFTVNGTFTISAPNKVRVAGGKTITLGPSASLVANGTAGNVIDWNVVSGTTPWTLSKASGAIDVKFNSFAYSTASGGAVFRAHASTDGGNNTGWNFPVARFWVGGAGNWSDTAHWASSSNGAGGQSVPTSSTDVFFDASSGSGTVSVDVTGNMNNLDCTGYIGALYGSTIARSMNVYGSFVLSSTMSITQGIGFVFYFQSNAVGRIITTAGQTVSYFIFSLTGGDITLQDNVTLNQYWRFSNMTGGTVNAIGKIIIVAYGGQVFKSSSVSGGTFDFTNSTISFSGGNQTDPFSFSPNMTLVTTGSTINVTFTNASYNTFVGGNHTFNVVNFLGTITPNISDSNTFTTLSRVNAGTDKTESIILSADQTISNNGTLTLTGGSDNRYRILVTSNTLGTRRTITLGTGVTTNIIRADFRDIGFASPIDLSGITGGAGDCLGNNNITFNTPRNMYWKTTSGGTVWWEQTNWYSQTNGGGIRYTDSPLPQDNVFFDANSISGGVTTIGLDYARPGANIDFTGSTSSLTLTPNIAWTIYGNLTLSSAMTFNAGSYSVFFEGRGSHTITSSGKTFYNLGIQSQGGTYTLQDNLIVSLYLAVNGGTLTAVTQNITTNIFDLNYSYIGQPGTSRTVNCGSGIWKFTNTGGGFFITATSSNSVINSQSSTFEFSGNFSSGNWGGGINIYSGFIFNNINFSGHATGTGKWIFLNNYTINGLLTISAPNRIRVTGGKTITLGPSASLVANGTLGNLIDWNVDSGTTPWILSKASGSIIVDYNSLSYSNATGGAGFYATNTTNGGNNSGWTFVIVPGAPISPIVTAGVGQVSLSWTAPASNGGLPVTDYVIEYKLSNDLNWSIFSDGVSIDTNAIVLGLSNGESYDFRISAVNPAGQGSPSDIVSAMPVTVPDAPTGVSAVAGNGQATVSFTPPVFNGGSAITSYTVTSSPGNITETGNSSPIVVSGLTNGISYTFTVTATNAIGTSVSSLPSSEIIPFTVPDAPTGVSAVAGNGQATVSFTPPVFNGGSAITSYTVTSSPGNITETGNSSPIVVSGLTSGESYTFTVKATNNAGSGASSLSSNQITLPTEPGAPVNLAGTVLGSSIGLSWSAPISDGGISIIDYVVEYKLTTGGVWSIFADGVNTNTTATVVGLSNENSYDFRVSAVNEVGTGLPSDIITRIPGEPAQVIIQSISDTTLPNIGADIRITNEGTVSYEYQYTWCITDSVLNLCGGGDDIFSATAAKLVGVGENWDTTLNSNILVPGNYYFHIKVLYGSDSSNAYQSFTAVATAPDAPTIGTATMGNRQASVSFTPPVFNGGSAITSYTVTSSPGNITETGNSSPIVVSGLTNGTSYTFMVIATNIIGDSLPSDSSNGIVPMTIPNPPTGVVAIPGDKQISLTWTAPLDDGGSPVIDYVIEYKLATDLVWLVFSDGISTNTNAVVSGLVNNLTYDFRVSAVNIMGQSLVNSINTTLPADQVNGGGSGYVLPPKPQIVENEISIENEKEIVEKLPEILTEKEKKLNKKDSKKEKINSNNNNNNLTSKIEKTNEVEATPKENPKITIVPEVLEVKMNTQNKTRLYAFIIGIGIVVFGVGIVSFITRTGIDDIPNRKKTKSSFFKAFFKRKKRI